jgi:hypothetical protein
MLAFNATPSFYDELLSGYDILLFALGSCIVISVLLLYYSQIPENKNSKSALDNPIYLSKDTLLQTTNSELNFILVEKTISKYAKLFVYGLIALVVFAPFYQLLGVNHFI